MHISIITLFPEIFETVLNTSILKRGQEKGKITYNVINLRSFGIGAHKTVDDKPFGGGAGMVLRVDVLHKAILDVKKKYPKTYVILLDPKGTPFTQAVSEQLVQRNDITLICGHYEGYDERIKNYIDCELSIGDFVLTGGEIPALAVIDSVVRLIPGVLGHDESNKKESFTKKNGVRILENPHYTRPQEYDGQKVPEILLSGDPKKVEGFRDVQAYSTTFQKRPDLLEKTTG